MPRKTKVGRRPRLHPFSAEYHALRSGPDVVRFSGRELDVPIETLWADERDRLDDEREYAAFWHFEHELPWDVAGSAAHLFTVALRRGRAIDEDEVMRLAPTIAAWDPRDPDSGEDPLWLYLDGEEGRVG